MTYAHTRSTLEANPPTEVFHTRQLSCPVLVTVYHMLECYDMNIISCADLHGRTGTSEDDGSFAEDEGDESDGGWCLFSIEVRNTYGLPFEVTFERNIEGRFLKSADIRILPTFYRGYGSMYKSHCGPRINIKVRERIATLFQQLDI